MKGRRREGTKGENTTERVALDSEGTCLRKKSIAEWGRSEANAEGENAILREQRRWNVSLG